MPLHRPQRSDLTRRFALAITGLPPPCNLPAKMVAPRGSALAMASPCSRVKPTRATDSATFAATAGETMTVLQRIALLRVMSMPCHGRVPQTAIVRVRKSKVEANCPGLRRSDVAGHPLLAAAHLLPL